MLRTTMVGKTWGACVGLCVLGAPVAMAWAGDGEPGSPSALHEPDHEDHHHRPALYDDPDFAVPPGSGAAPDYPLAVSFTPADPSNYTNGGIVSYDYVVVHTMQGYYGGSISWFQNPAANVSAHYVMRSSDGEVTQMVRNDDRAWHVGNSNPYALGIEHEGFIAEEGWYTWETYLSSARLTRWLCEQYGIPVDRDHIVGHVELPNQTHTDPGPLWDWPLYMALVRDVVPAGRIEVVVVDRGSACELTATADTYVKATLEGSDALADDERCLVPAGTTLTVLHQSDELVGHARLHFDTGGSPCAGALASEGFAWLADYDTTCDPAASAAVGAMVSLDGGDPVAVDELGRVSLSGIAPGSHTLQASADGLLDGEAIVPVEVYPGARVVVGLDPIPDAGDTGQPDPDPAGTTGDSGGDEQGATGADLPADDDGIPGGTDGADDGRALPPGFGEGQSEGCGCRHDAPPSALAWLWPGLLLGLRRRRSSAN